MSGKPTYRMVQRAYRVAVDPTREQLRQFGSHAGAARFAYNWGISTIDTALADRRAEEDATGKATTPVPGHFDLCKLWNGYKRTAEWTDYATGEVSTGIPWVDQVSSATFAAALRDADRGWRNYFSSRNGTRAGRTVGRPRFKAKKRTIPSFQLHGSVRMDSPTRVVLPKIGRVVVRSDADHAAAFARARRRSGGQRGIGNRRRARQLWRQLSRNTDRAATVRAILAAADRSCDREAVLAELNRLADVAARATKLAAAIEQRDKADASAAEATTDKARAAALRRADKAKAKIADIQQIRASRTQSWSDRKVSEIIKTGQVDPVGAGQLARAYGLTDGDRVKLVEASYQARIVRATITLGADGLWWMSLGCEVPERVRTAATRRQQRGGAVGMDLGTGVAATLSKRAAGRREIRSSRFRAQAQEELARLQRARARCEKDSRRSLLLRRRIGVVHAEVARLRLDDQHRHANRLLRNFAAVGVEGYGLQAQAVRRGDGVPRGVRRMRNRRAADTANGQLRTLLGTKAERNKVVVVKTGPHEPTGRVCARCGSVKAKPVPPWIEDYVCDDCGAKGSRRRNSALVLQREAELALERAAVESGSPEGGSVESRGGGVSPGGPSGTAGLPSAKRAARSRSSGRGQPGTPGP